MRVPPGGRIGCEALYEAALLSARRGHRGTILPPPYAPSYASLGMISSAKRRIVRSISAERSTISSPAG
jgi:hypothetical protein